MSPSVHKRSPIRRHSSDYSGSPVRGRSSPRRRNSPGKERSPPRHRSSPRRDKSPVWRRSSPRKERSPARHRSSPRPRSPIRSGSSHRTKSPAREKLHGRVQSPKHDRSISPVFQSPSLRTKRSERAQVERVTTKATERARSTSPVSRSPSPRTRRMKRTQIEWEANKLKERERSISPVSQSLSPRSKRLRRAQAEREAGKVIEREREGHNSRNGDKGRRRERDEDRELPSERRPARDKNDDGSSRSRNMRHGRSISPTERGHRSRYSSRSPLRASRTGARDEETHARGTEQQDDEYDDSLSKMKAMEESLEEKQKQKPSFELSGKLAAETNRVRGITLLFTEPPDARKPDIRWRLYVFKAGEVLNEPLYVHRQSCYLFGRERRVADIPTDHPSCSKQHAVIQFRLVEKEQADGMLSKQVRPYLMDLGSTNGTFINDNRIESQRYYELIEKDTIKFGNSSREYVILHENSTS